MHASVHGSIRKATVDGVTPDNKAVLTYFDTGVGGLPVPPPYLGGLVGGPSGFFSMPNQGDSIGVLNEPHYAAIGSIAAPAPKTTLPGLAPGQSAIYGPQGQILLRFTTAGMALLNQTTATSATSGAASGLPGSPAGYLSLAINGVTQKIAYWNS